MITSEDVRRVMFDKCMRGYRCEDVDDYLKQVAESMDALSAQNEELQKKLLVLAQRIDQYRAEEDTLRTTMINAQRLGENVIREAKQKAAEILREANIKAEDREQRAKDDVELARQEVVTLKSEADSFKRGLMDMYRKHINLISKLPDYTPAAAEPAPAPAAEPQPTEPPVAPAPAAEPAPEPVYTAQVEPEPQPVPQPEVVPEPVAAEPAPAYYEPVEPAQPAADSEKVDTVEFAIDNNPEIPGDVAQDNRFQAVSGLYADDDSQPAAPARKPRKSAPRRAPRKTTRSTAAAAQPQGELNSPAFDNFEGIDFDS